MAKFISKACKESPVFKQVINAMFREELNYCTKTGKVSSVVSVRESEKGTHIDVKRPIY